MFRVLLSVTITAALLLTLLALPLLYRIPNPLNSPLLNEVHELSHTALFFLVELLLLFALHYRWQMQPIKALLIASCATLSAGLGIELIQPFLDRTSSWLDMQRNLLGVIAANCAWLAMQSYLDNARRSALLGVAIATLLISGAGVYPWLIAQYKRDQTFPVLMDFEDKSLYRYADGAARGNLQIRPLPDSHAGDGPGARLFMPGDAQWPGMRVNNPYPDWSDYRKLKFDVYHSGRSDAVLGLNIYSAQSKRKPWGYKAFEILEGHNHLEFDLPTATAAGDEKITGFLIYSKSKGIDLSVYIDNIRLE